MACNEGDPMVKVIHPFDLYATYAHVEGRSNPLGHFEAAGVVCIDNQLNLSVTPGQAWTWVYFTSGIRTFFGVAPLLAPIAQPVSLPTINPARHVRAFRRAMDLAERAEEVLDNRATHPPYVAVQIAEAIDSALSPNTALLAAAKEVIEKYPGLRGKRWPEFDKLEAEIARTKKS
jgi:hypothetical protein